MLKDAKQMLNAGITRFAETVVVRGSSERKVVISKRSNGCKSYWTVRAQIQCLSTLTTNAMQKDSTETQNARTKTAHPVLSRCYAPLLAGGTPKRGSPGGNGGT